jgi:hypothetical protein
MIDQGGNMSDENIGNAGGEQDSHPDDQSNRPERPVLESMKSYSPPVEGADDGWVAEEAIEALIMERQMNPAETAEQLAERIFEENLPVSAQAICHLALNAGNAQVRFAAAKYVTERRMGKVGEARKDDAADDVFKEFMADVTVVVDERGEFAGVTDKQRR